MGDPAPVRMGQLPGGIPPDCVPSDRDLSGCGAFVEAVLSNPAPEFFTPEALWRDWMVFAERVRTRAGPEVIAGVWQMLAKDAAPRNFQALPAQHMKLIPTSSWVEVPFLFEARRAGLPVKCSGSASLVPHGSSWKMFCLVTILEQFEGQRSPDVWEDDAAFKGRLTGGVNGGANGASTGSDEVQDGAKVERYEAVIVGGGNGGICTAARLSAMGISNVIIEKDEEPGKVWKRRYDSLKLHTTKSLFRLPFDKTFEDDDPEYLNSSHIAKAFKSYVQKYQLNMRLSTRVIASKRDESVQEWRLKVKTDGQLETNIICKHLILSVGYESAKPKTTTFKDQERFTGKIIHASEWRNANGFSGKKGIVIGSATSAHDICMDMHRAGLCSVTMIQRSPTLAFPIEYSRRFEKLIYNDFIPLDMADRIAAKPMKVGCTLQDENVRLAISQDPERFNALERAGYLVDKKTGFCDLVISRTGGYFIDNNGSFDAIIAGDVKIKSDSAIKGFTPYGLAFADGTVLPADVVVFATGFDSDHRDLNASIAGEEAASKLGPWGGLNSEGELRGGPSMQEYPGLWRIGSTNAVTRFGARCIALRIQEEMILRERGHE